MPSAKTGIRAKILLMDGLKVTDMSLRSISLASRGRLATAASMGTFSALPKRVRLLRMQGLIEAAQVMRLETVTINSTETWGCETLLFRRYVFYMR